MPALSPHESVIDLRVPGSALRAHGPFAPRQEAALPLGAPEARIVASGCGGNVTRLAAPVRTLLELMSHLGTLAMSTRNSAAGLEVRGTYAHVDAEGATTGGTTRLLTHPEAWAHVFAVRGDSPARPTRRLAVFAADGSAVHEAQIQGAAAADAFDGVLAGFVADDQSRELVLRPLHRRAGERRLEVVRYARAGQSWEVTLWSLGALLERAAQGGTKLAITVGNEGVRHRWGGTLRPTRQAGPWATMLDEGVRLLVRRELVTQAWVARRYAVGGTVTTLELFDGDGHAIVVVSALGPRDDADWLDLVGSLPRRW